MLSGLVRSFLLVRFLCFAYGSARLFLLMILLAAFIFT